MIEKHIAKAITTDVYIKKFCLYGFLKNLQFFEPYLLIYFLAKNMNLLQIGFLFSIREIVTNVLEIPSGIIADVYGRKKSLLLAFLFYIVSFLLFYAVNSYFATSIAMIFFGFGQAFRSGTHKAMIYSYLEYKNWAAYKTFVYGRTRSFSLWGSALSALFAIVLMLPLQNIRLIFIVTIIPYIFNFLLIMSYPSFLDNAHKTDTVKFFDFLHSIKNTFFKNNSLKIFLSIEGLFEAIIASMKDFVQPIIASLITFSFIAHLSVEQNITVSLGIIYAIMNSYGAFFSRHAHIVKSLLGAKHSLTFLYVALGGALILLALSLQNVWIVLLGFFFIHILLNVRKPIFVDELDNYVPKIQRATILSLSSQLKSLFLIVLAPLTGFFADSFGIAWALMLLAGFVFLSYVIVAVYRKFF